MLLPRVSTEVEQGQYFVSFEPPEQGYDICYNFERGWALCEEPVKVELVDHDHIGIGRYDRLIRPALYLPRRCAYFVVPTGKLLIQHQEVILDPGEFRQIHPKILNDSFVNFTWPMLLAFLIAKEH